MAQLEYNSNGLLTNVNRLQWNETDDDYDLIAQSQYFYNANNQITSITHKNAADVVLVSHGDTFNTTGNITQYNNSLDGTVTYDYDFLGQLTGADYSALTITDESYTYDANGNRITANGDDYVIGDNNEMTSSGSWNYAYDAEGNRISKTNSTSTERELYAWDYRNRLTTVTTQTYNSETETWTTTQVVEYAYDYNNVLIRKILDSDTKTIFIPEKYQTAVQIDNSVVSHRYLWTPDQQDKLIADATSSETLWTLTDHLGTIRDVYQQTSSGLLQNAHINYDAYGNVLSCKDANNQTIDNPVIFGFTGKYFDPDTQLQNNVNRWYDSTTGRWLSTDPIGFNGNDANLYRYVGNKTIISIDFLGLTEKTFKGDGYIIEVHKGDADNLIEGGHGHFVQGKNSPRGGKISLSENVIYDSKNNPTGKKLPKKTWEKFQKWVTKNGFKGGCVIAIITLAPEVVSAAESDGINGVVQLTHDKTGEYINDVVSSGIVGTGVIGVAAASGSTMTVGGVTVVSSGTVVTGGVVASTSVAVGVGSAVIVAAGTGYAIGYYIGHSEPVQSFYDSVAEGIVWACPWCFGI